MKTAGRCSADSRKISDDRGRSRHPQADPDYVIEEAPFTVEVVDAMRQVPREDVPDMPDRIVAATAVYFGVPAISRDGRIRASNMRTVW